MFSCEENKKKILFDELINKGTEELPLYYYESELFNGLAFDVDENGNTTMEANFKEGKLHGLMKKSGYADCFCSGNAIEFDPVLWINDKSVSAEKRLDSDILVTSIESYKLGERHGEYKRWFENGQLQFQGSFRNGKLDGEFVAFNLNGKKTLELRYVNGDIIDEEYFEKSKEIITENSKQVIKEEIILNPKNVETIKKETLEVEEIVEKIINKRAIYDISNKKQVDAVSVEGNMGEEDGYPNSEHYSGGGFGDGLSEIDGYRSRPDDFNYSLEMGEGYITVNVVVNAEGKIIDIDNNSFYSTLGYIGSYKRKNLYLAIKQQLRYGPATGKDKSDKVGKLKLIFTY